MAPPPKKDAFADLFQSATSTNNSSAKVNNLSMSERQKQQQQKPGIGASNSTWSNIDVLSGASSRTGSPIAALNPTKPPQSRAYSPLAPSNVSTPSSLGSSSSSSLNGIKPTKPVNDPFDIFTSNASPPLKPQNGISTNQHPQKQQQSQSVTTSSNGMSLLDDDFIDAFPVSQPPPPQQPRRQPIAQPEPEPAPRVPRHSLNTIQTESPTSKKDSVLAGLVDIGFSIEDANEAISKQGLDLQACVNYIMSKSSAPNSRTSTPGASHGASHRNANGGRPGEVYNLNDMSSDFFKTANKLLYKSKQTVMKNLESLQLSGSSANSSTSSIPEWMKNQEKYKADAVEKKYGHGEEELDYGSDSENINQEEIERFMRAQKERDRERAKTRFDNIKNKALHMSGSSQTRRIEQNRERLADTKSAINRVPTPSRSPVSAPITPRAPVKKQQPAPQKEPENVDLLGISSSSDSRPSSSLRDSTPLNQFEQVDYTTAKETAQVAFKSGNYSTALESYLICLNKLSPKHELRVIIYSNLAVVYKLVGQLKQSLDAIESALPLISVEEEVPNSKFTIDSKPVKYWYTKLIITKAEVLELMEKYESSLDHYQILIKELGVLDKKIMDGRRRVDKIVNPDNHKVKTSAPPSAPKPAPPSRPSSVAPKPEVPDIDPLVKDRIDTQIQNWAKSKQNNLRALLTNLGEVIPEKINMNPALRNLTTNELMLNKQVKIQYMKVISSIHPDKLASQCKGDKEAELVCNGVFIILNKSWDAFKEENSM
ncbi:auxilin-like clathrin-binding protein required for normal clathrin function [Scheffersomyces xylosifermentans]|uniref:auxilin-like clathrin-binding protein required for normal clathrin function n=1 Tax=Scheffersomyces xylosifermentans TaxID=1304137 RepID=UPI00315C9CD2